jgi:hypothetical protein
MLEAILDNDGDRSFRRKSMSKKDEKPEDELISGLESEDRATLNKRKCFFPSLVTDRCADIV